MKQLLIDCISFNFARDLIFEETMKSDGGRRLIVKGILQRANIKNQNGRLYQKDTLMREAKKYEENFVRERRALGELDHPESSVVNLQNVSHNIIEVHWDGDDLMGTVEVLPTPNGNILKELFRSNIRLGISSRGMGTVNKGMREGAADIVADDFELIAFDFVSNPSTQGAFMFPSGNINENKNMVHNPITNKWETCENIIRDILTEIK